MRIFSSLALLAILAAPVAAAHASTITVNNPSFETLPTGGLTTTGCGVGCSYSYFVAIPEWNGGTGQFQPGPPANTAYYNYIPDGTTVAYECCGGSTISQTLGVTVQNGVIYTMTVQVGHRADDPDGIFDPFSVGLLVNGVYYAATGTDPGLGNWATYTATFTGNAINAGKPIEIDLSTNTTFVDFDAVTMQGQAPEPTSIALLGTGILSVAGFARRKFRA